MARVSTRTLAAFAADVEWLTAQGVTVARHNLSQDPQPFVSNTRVLDLMQREGTQCLPIVLVNGEELGHGAYPRREELARAAGLVASASQTKPRIRLSADRVLHARIGLLLMNALLFVPTRVLFFTGKGGVGKTSAGLRDRYSPWRTPVSVCCS